MRYEIEHPGGERCRLQNLEPLRLPQLAELAGDRSGRQPGGRATAAKSISPRSTRFFKKALPYYRQKGVLNEKPIHFDLERNKAAANAAALSGKDSGRRSRQPAVHCRQQSQSHRRGLARWQVANRHRQRRTSVSADGDFATAQFNHPQGMALARRHAVRGRHRKSFAAQSRFEEQASHHHRRHRRASRTAGRASIWNGASCRNDSSARR